MIAESEVIRLQGNLCTIVPLAIEHHDDLVDSVMDGELWRLWYTFVPEPQKVKDNIALRFKMQAEGSMIPFTVIDNHSSTKPSK